jgi:hypothetical protein
MKYILEDMKESEYEIIIVHQKDSRPFNRGALKNLGFLYIKEKYPDNYKNITLVFNDIDTIPYKKNLLDFQTKKNHIKHFYGFKNTLGGIFSILAEDFEKLNGFPNYWWWGFEDNVLYERAINNKLVIDRSNFFKIGDMNIIHSVDGFLRNMNKGNIKNFKSSMEENKIKNEKNGIKNLTNYKFNINKNDNTIDVLKFDCGINLDSNNSMIVNIQKLAEKSEQNKKKEFNNLNKYNRFQINYT